MCFLLLPSLQVPPVHMPSFLAFLPLTCRICLYYSPPPFSLVLVSWHTLGQAYSQTFLCSSGPISTFPSSPFAYHLGPSRKTLNIHPSIYLSVSLDLKTKTKTTAKNQHPRSFTIISFCTCIFVVVYNDNSETCQCIRPGCVVLKRYW